tara:strand:+ start:82 stop:321 length:240 start_codon:yes stop_codon:yes gene_type:complete
MLLPHITSLSIIQAINTTNPVISDTKIKKVINSLLLSKSFYLQSNNSWYRFGDKLSNNNRLVLKSKNPAEAGFLYKQGA